MGTQEEYNGFALLDKAGKGFDEDAETTVAHLEILANVDIEKGPIP